MAKVFFLLLSLAYALTLHAQPISKDWLGEWQSVEFQNSPDDKASKKTKPLIVITEKSFNLCLWSTKPFGEVKGQEMKCHASYTDKPVTKKELMANMKSRNDPVHPIHDRTAPSMTEIMKVFAGINSDKPFRLIAIYVPAGSGDCATNYIFDQGAIYELSGCFGEYNRIYRYARKATKANP